jgi:hypothetical protein
VGWLEFEERDRHEPQRSEASIIHVEAKREALPWPGSQLERELLEAEAVGA